MKWAFALCGVLFTGAFWVFAWALQWIQALLCFFLATTAWTFMIAEMRRNNGRPQS